MLLGREGKITRKYNNSINNAAVDNVYQNGNKLKEVQC
jgi:hypothetical protein